MLDCKHPEMITKNQHIHFCCECGSTVCQVTGAIRNPTGKVVGNFLIPDWEPLKKGDDVVYIGKNWPKEYGRVGKIFEMPMRPEGSVTVRYGSESSDGEYHCFSLADLKPAGKDIIAPKLKTDAPKGDKILRETLRLVERELREAKAANDGIDDLEKIERNLRRLLRTNSERFGPGAFASLGG